MAKTKTAKLTPIDKIALVLFKFDPVGLAKIKGMPKEEYMGEAKKIHSMLMNKGMVSGKKMIKFCDMSEVGVQSVVYATFISSFGEKMAGTPEQYKPIAEKILGCVKNTHRKVTRSDFFNGI